MDSGDLGQKGPKVNLYSRHFSIYLNKYLQFLQFFEKEKEQGAHPLNLVNK